MLKQIKTSTGLIIVFALAVVLFGGVYTYYNAYLPDITSYSSANYLIVPTTSTTATKDWKTYTNDTYGFSFKYPKDWVLTKPPADVTSEKSYLDQRWINYSDTSKNYDGRVLFIDMNKWPTDESGKANMGYLTTDIRKSINTIFNDIYTKRSLPTADLVLLKNTNGGDFLSYDKYYVAAKYIESSDGKWRGFTFYNIQANGDIMILQYQSVMFSQSTEQLFASSYNFSNNYDAATKSYGPKEIDQYNQGLNVFQDSQTSVDKAHQDWINFIESTPRVKTSWGAAADNIDLLIKTLGVTDPTADWQTYTNDTYGFSFKYPKEWETSKNAGTKDPSETTESSVKVGDTTSLSHISASKKTDFVISIGYYADQLCPSLSNGQTTEACPGFTKESIDQKIQPMVTSNSSGYSGLSQQTQTVGSNISGYLITGKVRHHRISGGLMSRVASKAIDPSLTLVN